MLRSGSWVSAAATATISVPPKANTTTSKAAPTPAQRQRLDALAAAGVETVCVRGDVSVRAEVDAAVAEVRARFGRLDAVVHAAGCLRDGLLMGKSAAAANEVLS
ncbi:SDR family oxidoreductase, partial [Lysobacter sp. 2RAB21]